MCDILKCLFVCWNNTRQKYKSGKFVDNDFIVICAIQLANCTCANFENNSCLHFVIWRKAKSIPSDKDGALFRTNSLLLPSALAPATQPNREAGRNPQRCPKFIRMSCSDAHEPAWNGMCLRRIIGLQHCTLIQPISQVCPIPVLKCKPDCSPQRLDSGTFDLLARQHALTLHEVIWSYCTPLYLHVRYRVYWYQLG